MDSEKINILYLHESSQIAGAENSLLELVRFIDHSRFRPFFVLPEAGPLVDELRNLAIEVHLINLPKIKKCIGVWGTSRKINCIIKEKDIKIIHSNSIRTHLYGFFANIRRTIPLVWQQRNLITTEWFDPDRLLSFVPQAIVCNSGAVACRFAKRGRYPSKISVIYNGVDTERFNPSVSTDKIKKEFNLLPERPVIGIIGRLGSIKGHEYFLRSIQIVIQSLRESQAAPIFLVVGDTVFPSDGWRKQYLNDLAKKLRIDHAVIFTGFRNDMSEVIAGMDIVISSALQEACSRAVLEAMASGKAVIATDVGGSHELVENGITGVLVPPRNPERMAEEIINLLNDRKKLAEMGANGRKRAAELFDIKTCVKKLENLYENLIVKRKER